MEPITIAFIVLSPLVLIYFFTSPFGIKCHRTAMISATRNGCILETDGAMKAYEKLGQISVVSRNGGTTSLHLLQGISTKILMDALETCSQRPFK
jgi:hypothetical protein